MRSHLKNKIKKLEKIVFPPEKKRQKIIELLFRAFMRLPQERRIKYFKDETRNSKNFILESFTGDEQKEYE